MAAAVPFNDDKGKRIPRAKAARVLGLRSTGWGVDLCRVGLVGRRMIKRRWRLEDVACELLSTLAGLGSYL